MALPKTGRRTSRSTYNAAYRQAKAKKQVFTFWERVGKNWRFHWDTFTAPPEADLIQEVAYYIRDRYQQFLRAHHEWPFWPKKPWTLSFGPTWGDLLLPDLPASFVFVDQLLKDFILNPRFRKRRLQDKTLPPEGGGNSHAVL